MKFNKTNIILSFILLTLLVSSCNTFSVPPYRGPISDHFDGEKFVNQDKKRETNYLKLFYWLAFRESGFWADWYPDIEKAVPQKYVGNGNLKVTYINHASVLIQFDSINVLSDPVWSDVVTPVKPFGPERRRPNGIEFQDLPPIDVVIISHNHYDHLDIPTLNKLKEKFNPKILFPLGNMPLFKDYGFTNVQEMDWWDSISIKNKKFTFVPARHFSNRGLVDRNTALWGGYVMETAKEPVYFAGDTGFGMHYEQIKEKFGDMRFSILPIAPIEPRWFMQEVHQDAEEAVLSHISLNSKKSMGIHFGTFRQAEDNMDDPVKQLILSLEKHNISKRAFILPRHGRIINVD